MTTMSETSTQALRAATDANGEEILPYKPRPNEFKHSKPVLDGPVGSEGSFTLQAQAAGDKPWTSDDVRSLESRMAYCRAIQLDEVFNSWTGHVQAKIDELQAQLQHLHDSRAAAPQTLVELAPILETARKAVAEQQERARQIALKQTLERKHRKAGTKPKAAPAPKFDLAKALSMVSPEAFAQMKANGVDFAQMMRDVAAGKE